MTGGGNDTGIDGLAILVNGTLVTSVEEVEDLLETNGYIEASFLFIQGKTSSSFDAGEIGNFCTGVRDFFSRPPALPRNAAIDNAAVIQAAIYDNSARFRRGNPHCRLYYVTTGRWQGAPQLEGRVATEV